MPHIGQHRFQPIMRDHLVQLLNALLIRCQLRPQIGDILLWITRRIQRAVQNLHHFRLTVFTAIDQLEIVDQHAFLINMR